MRKAVVLTVLALALLCGTAHAQCCISNGDFENGTTDWTKTQGYFAVSEYPAGSGNHVALLRGASGYTSEITQTFSADPGAYALFLDTGGSGQCTTKATVTSGANSYSTTVSSNAGTFNLDFRVSADSTATLKITVTCSTFLGMYNRVDNVSIYLEGP
jgi:hypothetical protein